MEIFNLNEMVNGWFVGAFEPSILKSNQFEIAVKSYSKGDYEQKHYHKEAKEITVIVSGEVKMNGQEYKEGDIIVIFPNEITDFLALTDCKTAVVKTPSTTKADKYLVGE
jgi:quercetin dioxygenase-like cupin family protein